MRRRRFSFLLRQSLAALVLAVALLSTATAKPKFKILHTVPGGLFSGLTFDAKGNLYGVTGAGGDNNHGTIFQLAPGAHGWTLNVLHKFNGYDGGTPNGGLIFDAGGNLYGTSPSGGAGYNGGNVFEMTPGSSGWTFSVLYNFCLQYHCPDGGSPQAGVIVGDGGNLYGTTAGGGSIGEGIVFELTSGSEKWDERVLYNFDGNKGGIQPYASLIVDSAGNLYGTTTFGGKVSSSCYFGCGTVFKLQGTPSHGWKEHELYDFHGYDGKTPTDGLVFGDSDDLYGATNQGGSSSCGETTCGTVFRLTKGSNGHWKETVLYDFPNPASGSNPTSGVIFDRAGSLYGTAGGGNGSCSGGCGVVYKLTPTTNGKWKYRVLHKFTGRDGGYPGGGVVLDRKGNVYGTAYTVVYKITP